MVSPTTMSVLIRRSVEFFGGHQVTHFKLEGFWVGGVGIELHTYAETEADDFVAGDLCDPCLVCHVVDRRFDESYQLAADMGGAGYVSPGENDANAIHNSATMNLNVVDACHRRNIGRVFFSSSACVYPAYNQEDPCNPFCPEDSTVPAAPDSDRGRKKPFSERLYLTFNRNYGTQARIGRYHNILGPEETWQGGRERCLRRAAARSRRRARATRTTSGTMASRRGPSPARTMPSRVVRGAQAPLRSGRVARAR